MTQAEHPQTVEGRPRTARMMMGELMMQAEHWVVDGLPSLIPPRVDQQKYQARLEEMVEQARSEADDAWRGFALLVADTCNDPHLVKEAERMLNLEATR